MSTSSYLAGLAFLAVTLGAAAAGGWIVVRRQGPGLERLPRALAWAVIAAGVIFLAHLLPGIFGILSRYSAAGAALLLGGAIVAFVPARRAAGEAGTPAGPRTDGGFPLLGAAGAAAVAVYLLAAALTHSAEGMLAPDTATFHLPNVARWIQTGSMWGIHDFVPNRAPGDYPETGDLFMLAAVMPWKADFLARFVGLPFLALLGFGVYAAGRELGAARSPSLLAASALVAMPAVGYVALVGLADPEMLGTFAVGGYFLLRQRRTGDRFDLICAGIGLGLSFGTRWYAVPAVAAAVVAWLAGPALARRWIGSRAPRARELAVLVGAIALFGGFWIVRNWVGSGNPVFPVRVAPFGITIFGAPPDQFRASQGFTLAHYLGHPGIFRTQLWPTYLGFMGWSAVALWALAAASGVRSLRGVARGESLWGRPLALVGVAAVIGAVYMVTPYTATGPPGFPKYSFVNARYVVPALAAAAPAGALLVSRAGRLRVVLEVLLLAATADGIRRISEAHGTDARGVPLVATVLLAVAVATAAVLWRRQGWTIPRQAFAYAAVAGVLSLVAVGYVLEHRYYQQRYAGATAPFDYVDAFAPSGARIGIVGEGWDNYPLFGPRFGNHVAAIAHREDGMLRSYRSKRAFDQAVRAGGYQLVWSQDIDLVHPGLPPRQDGWLRRLGFRVVASGGTTDAQVHLFAARGSPYRPLAADRQAAAKRS